MGGTFEVFVRVTVGVCVAVAGRVGVLVGVLAVLRLPNWRFRSCPHSKNTLWLPGAEGKVCTHPAGRTSDTV
jgi:hypothetical protein